MQQYSGRLVMPPPANLLGRLASPRLMVAVFVITALAALVSAHLGVAPTLAMLPPLLLLVANLSAAIVVHPRFRANLPLLVFHLALIALVVILLIARLVFFEGKVAITSGTQFDGQWSRQSGGPASRDPGSELDFENVDFIERFAADGRRLGTVARLRWRNESGKSDIAEAGEDSPLILHGVRIYPIAERGFAPVLRWESQGGSFEIGTVHLHDDGQGGFTPDGGWRLPDGQEMWAMVEPLATAAPTRAGERTNLGAHSFPHRLVVRIGNERREMRPGDTIDLTAGRLTYLELRAWLGFRATYDPTMSWLLATVAVAVLALAAFYFRPPASSDRRPLSAARQAE